MILNRRKLAKVIAGNFLLTFAAYAQPYINIPTQARHFNHTHESGATGQDPGGEGGQLGIGAFLQSILSGGATATKLGTVNTSLTSGFCLEADANGNIKTAASGAPCGTGSGNTVDSVFGRTGAVVAATNDYDFTQINGTNAVNKGGTGATTLTGILEGNGTSAFTANATSTPYQFFRSKGNTSTGGYEFVNQRELWTSDYNYSMEPGGSLIAGANTITLTPCPLGVSGSAANLYAYISGGVGSAESVHITAGSCTSGAASGTVTFTTAGTHSGAWTIASATGGLREAVLASGGSAVIMIPAATTLLISGSLNGVYIDQNNLTIAGQGWTSVVKARDNAALNVVVYAPTCANCKFLNFKIDGNRANSGTNPTFGCGLETGTAGSGLADHLLIQGMEITLSAFFGVLVNDTSVDVEVSRNYIHNNGGVTDDTGDGIGIFIFWANPNTKSKDVRVIGNYISDNHNTVTSAGDSTCMSVIADGAIIRDNYCLNNFNVGGGQLAVTNFSSNVTISDNIVITGSAGGLSEVTAGIESDGSNLTITGNIVRTAHSWAIALEGKSGGQGAHDAVIMGNVLDDCATACIGLLDAGGYVSGITITGNRINAGATTGIDIGTASLDVVVTGNNLVGSTTTVTDGSTVGAIVTGNFPYLANLTNGGSVASANTLTLRCDQTATITGAVTVKTITVPTNQAPSLGTNCTVTLIPAAGATWVTDATGNIGLASTAVVGKALILTQYGTKFWPSY